MRRCLLACFVALWAGSAQAEEQVDRLWADEGATLRRLVEASRGQQLGEALLRLGLWERDTAQRLVQRDGDATLIEQHRDRADEVLSQSLEALDEDRLPVALFTLGDLRRSRGQYEAAREPLARLVTTFPDAPLALDASLALGDDAFEEARLADAVARYDFVIARAPPGDAAAWARYKLAWCRINLADHGDARRLFREVAARGEGSSLVEEARRDFVIALARDASVDSSKAIAEIDSLIADPARRRRYGEGWANLVAAAGRDEDAAAAYARLIPGAPMDEAARMLAASLHIAVRRRDRAGVLQIGQRLADVFEARPGIDGVARESGERALRVAAITFHGEGRAAGDDARLAQAFSLYEAYFRGFPADPHAYELHHHAGELLLSLKRPELSERHYTAAVLLDLKRLESKQPPGRWLASAARGAVVAAQALVEQSTKKEKPSKGPDVRHASTTVKGQQPFLPSELVLVAACDRYLRALPDGEHAVEVAFQRGLLFYRRQRFDDALGQLRTIALEHSASELASTAAEASLDALKQLERWDELAALARELSSRGPLASALGTHLTDVRQSAMLAAAEQLATSGRHDEAARRYLEMAGEFPKGTQARTAIYNAAASLAVTGRLDEAVKVRAKLLDSKEGDRLHRRALERQAEDLLRLGRFAQAARVTLRLSDELKGKDRAARLHDAVLLADAAGNDREARRLREKYVREHRRGADVFAHALELAEGTRGCVASMKAFRHAVRRAPGPAERAIGLARTARAEARCHEDWWARKHAGEALALRKRVPADRLDALDALADAELLLTDAALEKYRRMKVRAPFQKTIPRKLEALQVADAALARVVALGRPKAAICALTFSGQAWAEFARTLSAVRAPSSFTEEQRMLFEEELASKAQPLADRALTTLREARAKAHEAGLAPPCLASGLDALARLAPEQFAPRLESIPRLAQAWTSEDGAAADVLLAAPDAPAAWLIAARRELTRNRTRAALLLVGRLEENDPLFARAARIRFEALRRLDREEAARSVLLHAARVDDQAWAQAELADRALAARDYVLAREALGRLLRTRDDASVRVALGIAARALGDASFARASLNQALALDDENAEAHLAMGLLLCAEGNAPAEGIEALERFASLGGQAPNAAGLEGVKAACAALAKEAR